MTKLLAVGESLILTSGGDSYFGPPDSSALPFPSGVPVYAFVDSVNYNTNYGNVQEGNEANNLLGPVVSTAGDLLPVGADFTFTPAGLPKR